MSTRNTATGTLSSLTGMAFEITTGSGHHITLDASDEHGGSSQGPSPMNLVLAGLAGCTGMDVIAMLRKMRQDVTAYEVHVSGTQAEEHPRVYTNVEVQHVITGHNLDRARVEHAVELSATRYCPVSATLSGVGNVEHTVLIREANATCE